MDEKEIIKYEILGRIKNNDEFTFYSLHCDLPDSAYRIADRLIQKFRKEGKIKFERRGRQVIWRKVINE